MNDYYVKDISRKIRSSIHAKMGSGEYLPASGSIPYGYMRDPENNTFAIDTETAPIVLRIFQMRADGISFNGICRTLNAEGIPCPGKLRYDRGLTNAPKYKDAVWIRSTVRKIIQDRVYIGCRVHGKISRSKVGLDKQSRPEDEWTVIQAAHPALVSDELFEYVQQINAEELEKRRQYARRTTFRMTIGNCSVVSSTVQTVIVPCPQGKAVRELAPTHQAASFTTATPTDILSIPAVQVIMSGRSRSIPSSKMRWISR